MIRNLRFDAKGRRVVEEIEMRCTPAQMRLALHRADLLATVEQIVAADPEAAIVWEFAVVMERASPFIDAMKGQAFTDEQIDNLFATAMKISL